MRRLDPLPEIRRLVYGCVGLVVGIVVARIAGFHVVVRHVSLGMLESGGPVADDPVWLSVFVLGFAIGIGAIGWFWLVRPLLSRPPDVEPSRGGHG